MMDWMRFSIRPTEENLLSYPTILDVLRDVVAEEERVAAFSMPLDENRSYLSDLMETGHYSLMQHSQSSLSVLFPTGRSMFTFYRGQSHFYEHCLPSLYRFCGDKLEEETFRSYFQTAEMILVMKTHPVIRYIETRGIVNDKLGVLPLPVHYDGLAQHYGIKTCYLDFTNDIWAAAFFASTTFDGKKYRPKHVDDNDVFADKYGVLYRLKYMSDKGVPDSEIEEMMPIGLQHFNRPGRQSGLVRSMVDVRDLHSVSKVERVFFRHDNESNDLLFTLSQFGKKYMPEDSLVGIVEAICADNVFCEKTIGLVRDIYFPQVPIEAVREKAASYGYRFIENLKTGFDRATVDMEYCEWQNGGSQRYIDSIIVIPFSYLKI